MTVVTVRHSAKPFTWSYSRLKNYEGCPKRHQEIDILKNYKEESEHLDYGDMVHKAAAARLGKGTPLSMELEPILEPWCRIIESTGGKILVEQKLAITKDFQPTGYFDRNVWFRSVADVIQIDNNVAGVYDWKTGKIQVDSVQLALCAQCVFSHHPEVKKIQSVFVWLKEDTTSTEQFVRKDMVRLWESMRHRVAALEQAYATNNFPPIHNQLCRKWCPVETCEFHGVSKWE